MSKFLLGLICGVLILAACAGGSKSYKPNPRKMQKKLFVSCDKSWISNPEGKLCSRACIKRRGKKCLKWGLEVLDFDQKDDWQFFKDAEFGCMQLDQIL